MLALTGHLALCPPYLPIWLSLLPTRTEIGRFEDQSFTMGRKLGLFRAIYLVSASCMGSFAFAFDTGVISMLRSLCCS